ncbi:hypothetical protein TruAng_003796 [Truncatella angustata]|nr:hypothetical protein TruAng_003796 [Truncatella angustata]
MTTVAGGLPTPGLHEGLEDVDPFLLDALKKVEEDFKVDTAMLKKISQRFEEELHEGLAKTGANLSMNVTWVKGFPTGKEKGSYLTIDLGGTNMRVCWITLHGNGSDAEVVQDMFKLPPEIKKGEAHELWALVSEYLQKFIEKHDLKRFDIKGVEGQDVAGQLRDALEQRKLPVELVALINDTTGALIASAYNDPETIIGVIFGTGCNGAYMEDVGSIHKLKSSLPKDTPMAINCEYGAFDNSRQILPRTKYDIHIDNKSPRPGEQAFEKMSAGLYLGEIFRLVLEDMHSQSLMFKNQDVSLLHKEYHLDTGFLSALENHGEEEMMARFKEDLNIKPTKDELKISRCLAAIIALRGARLCACGVAAICHKKGLKSGHVAADGSVANKHPKFKLRWADALGEILDWPSDRTSDPITLTSAEDGSGVGAAVISAMAVADRG